MAKDFENAKTGDGIHYSRYIASWHRMGGTIFYGGLFEKWLRDKEHLTEMEISDIMLMATNGKLELQKSAKEFIDSYKGSIDYEAEIDPVCRPDG